VLGVDDVGKRNAVRIGLRDLEVGGNNLGRFRGTAGFAMQLKNEVRGTSDGGVNADVSFQPAVTVVVAGPVWIERSVIVTSQVAVNVGGAVPHSPPHQFALR